MTEAWWKICFDCVVVEFCADLGTFREVVHRHRLVHTRTHDRTRVHIKSTVGIEAHTSERKQGGLIITGDEVQWHC